MQEVRIYTARVPGTGRPTFYVTDEDNIISGEFPKRDRGSDTRPEALVNAETLGRFGSYVSSRGYDTKPIITGARVIPAKVVEVEQVLMGEKIDLNRLPVVEGMKKFTPDKYKTLLWDLWAREEDRRAYADKVRRIEERYRQLMKDEIARLGPEPSFTDIFTKDTSQ